MLTVPEIPTTDKPPVRDARLEDAPGPPPPGGARAMTTPVWLPRWLQPAEEPLAYTPDGDAPDTTLRADPEEVARFLAWLRAFVGRDDGGDGTRPPPEEPMP